MGFALSDMQLRSPAFSDGQPMAQKYSSEGENVSPPLIWSDAPAQTKSFAVFCHDPDAPLVSKRGDYGFTHWVLYNIPANVTKLEEGCRDYAQGKNNFDKSGYGGPLPPNGHGRHRYFFWILALDVEPTLQDGLGLSELLEKVEPHILGMNRVVGTYERR